MGIKEIKKMLKLQDIKKDPKHSGKFGEDIGKQWLLDEWEIIDVSDSKEPFFNTEELKQYGAKRPDFVSIFDNDNNQSIILWDAKFHNVKNDSFTLTNEEIEKYGKLKEFFCREIECEPNDVHIIFMVLPKSNDGNKMYLLHLNEFKTGEGAILADKLATKVILNELNCYDTSSIQMEILERHII
jgi:hypothetical protein